MSADIVRAHLRNGELSLAVVAARGALADAAPPAQAELWALLARALCRSGDPRDAARAAHQAAEVAQRDPPGGALGAWEVALALGEAQMAQGEPFAARATLTEAYEVLRARHPALIAADQPVDDVMRSIAEAEVWLLVALAEAHRAAGDAHQGLGVATRALVVAERRFGAASIEAADALLALAGCRHGAGLDANARLDLLRALKIRRERQPGHPDLAATLDLLGVVCRAQGKAADAVKWHREALAVWQARLGERAGPVGACRHALAQALHRTGDFEGARREMGEAVAITGRAFGADHVDAWIARFELGRFEVDCGLVEEGLARMDEARRVVGERLGDGHPVVAAMDRWL